MVKGFLVAGKGQKCPCLPSSLIGISPNTNAGIALAYRMGGFLAGNREKVCLAAF